MPVEFTETGYLEVWLNGVKLSQHRQEREAVEAILAHSETSPDGVYEIRRGPVKVKVNRGKVFGQINGAAVL